MINEDDPDQADARELHALQLMRFLERQIQEVWSDPACQNHVVPDAIRYTIGDFMRYLPELLGEDSPLRFVADHLSLDPEAHMDTKQRKERLTFRKARQYAIAICSQLEVGYGPSRGARLMRHTRPGEQKRQRFVPTAPIERVRRHRGDRTSADEIRHELA